MYSWVSVTRAGEFVPAVGDDLGLAPECEGEDHVVSKTCWLDFYGFVGAGCVTFRFTAMASSVRHAERNPSSAARASTMTWDQMVVLAVHRARRCRRIDRDLSGR